MHNKRIEIVMLIGLLSIFRIPSSLGIYRGASDSTGSVSSASWYVDLNQTNISGNVSATVGSTNGTYTLKIVSDSEVDTNYSITVSNVPSGVDVSLDNYNNGAFQTPISGTTTFSNAGTILYTGSSVEVTRTLTFRANSGATIVNDQQVDITVNFLQN